MPKPKKTDTAIKIHCANKTAVHWSKLKPNPANPNKHSPDSIKRLADIIRYHGWRRPVTVSNLTGMIVGGHARYEAAKLMDVKAPVDYQDFANLFDENSFMLADNRIAELADLDTKEASQLLESMKGEPALKFAGFTDAEIAKMSVEVSAHRRTPGPGGNPVISYSIVFDNEEQQETWFALIRDLRERYASLDSIGARLAAFIDDARRDRAKKENAK